MTGQCTHCGDEFGVEELGDLCPSCGSGTLETPGSFVPELTNEPATPEKTSEQMRAEMLAEEAAAQERIKQEALKAQKAEQAAKKKPKNKPTPVKVENNEPKEPEPTMKQDNDQRKQLKWFSLQQQFKKESEKLQKLEEKIMIQQQVVAGLQANLEDLQ